MSRILDNTAHYLSRIFGFTAHAQGNVDRPLNFVPHRLAMHHFKESISVKALGIKTFQFNTVGRRGLRKDAIRVMQQMPVIT
jgi:hypothetical protein